MIITNKNSALIFRPGLLHSGAEVGLSQCPHYSPQGFSVGLWASHQHLPLRQCQCQLQQHTSEQQTDD
jgi:hypothetical protein